MVPPIRRLHEARAQRRDNPYERVGFLASQSLDGKDPVIVTDVPWQMAWFADCRTVWLPHSREDLDSLQQILPVDAVILTDLWTPGRMGWGQEWVDLLARPQKASEFLGPEWMSQVLQEEKPRVILFERQPLQRE